MSDWKCPIESIDKDIRDVIKLIYENNMKPYMSCSGSYKDHQKGDYLPECACIQMLDSEMTRDFIAILINDKRFTCSISKETSFEFYGNNLPTGLRFHIEFNNILGDMQQVLSQIIQSIIQGKKPPLGDRKIIDIICDSITSFDVTKNKQIKFTFNNKMIQEDTLVSNDNDIDNNYSIEIKDSKDFTEFAKLINHAIADFEQNENGSTFYGTDILSMLAVLKKFIIDYNQIPKLKPGTKPSIVSLQKTRVNIFTYYLNKQIQMAQAQLEATSNLSFESIPIDLNDFII